MLVSDLVFLLYASTSTIIQTLALYPSVPVVDLFLRFLSPNLESPASMQPISQPGSHSHKAHNDKEVSGYHTRQGVLRDSMARAMLRLERRPNEGPYLVGTGVPPQLFDEWSAYDSWV